MAEQERDNSETESHYVVILDLWPEDESRDNDLGRHRSKSSHEANSKIGAINAALYDVRGRKSRFEAAHVDAEGPMSKKKAMEQQYE